MKSFVFLALGVFCVSFAAAQEKAEGYLLAPQGVGFEVRFPTEPVRGQVPSGDDIVYSAKTPRKKLDELGLSCHWILHKEPLGDEKAVAKFLKDNAQGAFKASRGKLLEDEVISLNGIPGRKYTIEINEQNVLTTRVYAIGSRAIYVGVMGKDRDAVSAPEATRFFDSLKIRE